MHPISDKELDKLFQQRFEGAEIQPSGDVWGKISAKMDDTKKGRKSFPLFWMAAASVLVVLGASLWLYRPADVIKLQGTGEEMVQVVPQSPISDLGTGAPRLDPHQPEIKGFDFAKLAVAEQKSDISPEEAKLPERVSEEISRPDLTPSNNLSRKSSPEVLVARKEVNVPRYTGDQSKLDVTQPDMIASVEVEQEEMISNQEPTPSKRIRSVGSLVNFVISKVDRRDDKIIEFKDGEEGSEVSGINLGLIKLKSRIK